MSRRFLHGISRSYLRRNFRTALSLMDSNCALSYRIYGIQHSHLTTHGCCSQIRSSVAHGPRSCPRPQLRWCLSMAWSSVPGDVCSVGSVDVLAGELQLQKLRLSLTSQKPVEGYGPLLIN